MLAAAQDVEACGLSRPGLVSYRVGVIGVQLVAEAEAARRGAARHGTARATAYGPFGSWK